MLIVPNATSRTRIALARSGKAFKPPRLLTKKIKALCKRQKRVRLSCPQKPSLLFRKHRSMSDQVTQLYPVMQAH